jgi:hypothetical protein
MKSNDVKKDQNLARKIFKDTSKGKIGAYKSTY